MEMKPTMNGIVSEVVSGESVVTLGVDVGEAGASHRISFPVPPELAASYGIGKRVTLFLKPARKARRRRAAVSE